jgi:pyruvate kinase
MIRNYNEKNSLYGESICSSAVKSAFERKAKAIFVVTRSGSLGRIIAKYKPSIPIYALWYYYKIIKFSYDENTRAWLSLSWGVSSFLIDKKMDSIDSLITYTTNLSLYKGIVQNGDKYVLVMSVLQGKDKGDLLKLVRVEF